MRQIALSIPLVVRAPPRLLGMAIRFVVAISAVGECSANDAPLRERFLVECPVKWEEYKHFSRRLQGSAEYSERITRMDGKAADGKRVVRTRMFFKQGSGGWSSTVRGDWSTDKGDDATVKALNQHYAFQLKRVDEASPWMLTALDENVVDRNSASLRREREMVDRVTCTPLVVYNIWLPELVQMQQFILKSVSMGVGESAELVKVEYDYRPPELGNHPACGGWVLLDPNHDWVLREFEVAAEWADGKGTLSAKYDYDFDSFKHPIITRYSRRQLASASGKQPFETEILDDVHFDFTWRDDVPDSEFKLSAFDLSEPGGQSGRLWIIGINVVAIAFIILGFIIRKFSRPRSVAPDDG